METKLCTRCKQDLPFPDSFFRDKTATSGYKGYCRKCDYSYRRNPRDKDRQAVDKRRQLNRRRKDDPAYREWKAQKDREYRQTPQGRARMARYKASRKARELGGSLTGEQWLAALAAFGDACAYCGAGKRVDIDHFIPLYLGGRTEAGNIVPACPSCNSSKQHKHPQSWCAPETYSHVVDVLRILV